MIAMIARPLRGRPLLLWSLCVSAAFVAYHIVYDYAAHDALLIAPALSHALVMVLPWLTYFEILKRIASWPFKLLTFASYLIVSVGIIALTIGTGNLVSTLIGQLPAALLALGLAEIVGPLLHDRAVQLKRIREQQDRSELRQAIPWQSPNIDVHLPLLPPQIEWIAAAGNYVELHDTEGRTRIHRIPLRTVEAALDSEGFVRIHRSTLVQTERIAAIEPGFVQLISGERLKVGPRYRSEVTKRAA